MWPIIDMQSDAVYSQSRPPTHPPRTGYYYYKPHLNECIGLGVEYRGYPVRLV